MPTAEKRAHIVSRARELADSGHYSGWLYIQRAMLETNQMSRQDNPLDDFRLRLDLDARCLAARQNRLLNKRPSRAH